ncbi:MAG: Ldh family oxidoreductase [Pseudomonadota bacterium]
MQAIGSTGGEDRLPQVRVDPFAMQTVVAGILEAHDVPPDDAAIVARCLGRADLRDVMTHGVSRLPHYTKRLRAGLINPRPELAPRRPTPVASHLDGQNGFGFVTATRAMDEALDIAGTLGFGLAAVCRSTHFGMAAVYVLQAVEAGYACCVFTNASRATPPWGGRTPMFGTSPLAFGFPTASEAPFVFDMSTTTAARTKVREAERLGQDIPEGYALDADGAPTTDPRAALQGSMLPIGGPKGSGLAMVMDIFAGVFTDAAFAGGVRNMYDDFDQPQNVGHLIMAFQPDLFAAGTAKRMDELVHAVHASPTAKGVDRIRLPGERGHAEERRRSSAGIPYRSGDLAAVLSLAAAHDVAVPDHWPLALADGA